MSPTRAIKLAILCFILVTYLLVVFNCFKMNSAQRFLSIEYKVFGRVQGELNDTNKIV